MSPQVEAAWIALSGVVFGVSGTVIVAWLGFRNTRAATEKSLRAARNDRLWARKADAYQDALTEALRRNQRRFRLLEVISDADYAQARAERLELEGRQEWWNMRGRLSTFGAPEVVEAFTKSMAANAKANITHGQWRDSADKVDKALQTSAGLALPEHEPLVHAQFEAQKPFLDALNSAVAADNALYRAIRDDLKQESDDTQPPG